MDTDTLKAEIKAKVEGKSSPFAVFDFDNTCVVNDVGEATFAYVCRNKLLKDAHLLGAVYEGDYHEAVFEKYHELCSSGRIEEGYLFYAKMFSGFSPEEAADVTRAAIVEEGGEIGSTILYGEIIARGLVLRPEVIELMEFLRSLGVKIWVVSASLEVSVRVAMEHFGIGAELIGVRPVIRDGKLTAELTRPVSIVKGKVDCLRTYIDKTASPFVAVDDSPTGLPLLETADIKVVVDRNNALSQEARKRGWHLIGQY